MNRRSLCLAAALGLVLGAGLAAAQEPKSDSEPPTEPKSTSERLREKASGAVQSLKRGVSSAGESMREQYRKALTAAQNMTVHNRVYARLHWDKGLVGAKIETEVREDGVTTLKGTVPNAKAKAKAVLLASDTVGVTQVVDQLTIQPASENVPKGTTTIIEEKKIEIKPAPPNP